MPKHPSRRSSGFTLVEMLAVAVLTALLMIAAMGVVSSLARSKVRVAPPHGDWRSVMRADLASARSVLGGERLAIVGMGLMDEQGVRVQRPARVEYGVEEISGKPWLVRWQTALSDRGEGLRERAALVAGVDGFAAEVVLSPDQEEGTPPRQVRVRLNATSEVVTGW